MQYSINTGEVNVDCDWEISDLRGLRKDNVKINIIAKGDLPHHVIEGIIDCLKKIQPHNPHLGELNG